MIIDDKSRLIVGGRFFFEDNSVNFQNVLKDAIATKFVSSPAKVNILSIGIL